MNTSEFLAKLAALMDEYEKGFGKNSCDLMFVDYDGSAYEWNGKKMELGR